ncbi:MAG: hypothetical protein HC822_08675 [Oscillochloris sp.]|nr:hypothetical protein [Oscillochloris sp.]
MANNSDGFPSDKDRPAFTDPSDAVVRSVRAWNELFAASTDMAFDLVLKNWDYRRSLRGAADQAVADTLKVQQRLSKEMLQAWQGYASDIQDLLDQANRDKK